jgi:VIT1/CCC1 family predicted Fe2+/Mn2+ transporter
MVIKKGKLISAGERKQPEQHAVTRLGWLRAAVLGANDGLLSTSSLTIGVASAQGSRHSIIVAGLSGLVAGAMSMAAGEFVSVSSQSDSENADIDRERAELIHDLAGEKRELTGIYIRRGLDKALAVQVAEQLMKKDAIGAHARDELGISDATGARPVQAALTSAASFSVGAILPLVVAIIASKSFVIGAVSAASLLFLAILGVVGAKIGGSNLTKAVIRVTFWGALAMAVTAGIGAVFGSHV